MSGGGHDDGGLPEEHEEHANHEAWVIPYADLLTLLMAMFIALFAMSTVDMSKFKALAVGFHEALGGGKFDTQVFAGSKSNSIVPNNNNGGSGGSGGLQTGGKSFNNGNGMLEALAAYLAQVQAQKSAEQNKLQGVQQKITNAAALAGLANKIGFELRDNGLVVRIVTDEVLFPSGSAQLQSEGTQILGIVGNALRDIPNRVQIVGYTDSDKIHTVQFPTNQELSSARADAVLRFFGDQLGLDVDRFDAIGRGELHPLAPNDTPQDKARNRRVEIIIQSQVVDSLLAANDLNGRTVDPRSLQHGPDLRTIVGRLDARG